ncbi:hypothetical protein [Bradyrhizobium sp. cf659]|uniref:hypothetical protein n=1 Tax=Bradyrhizobium sp. cf659 TaxID=1761771 RepID=UPI0008DF378A|nr:hypothetical protein [Bradyrhizobium sp. cf659]SFK09095.1 hypothetical protein SAMN04487925_11771 [Bradyrhizobium sp. cf659]
MHAPKWIEFRNAVFYFSSIAINLFFFMLAITYIVQTISINSGRISDLALIDSNLKASAVELTQNRTADDVAAIREAIKDNTNRRAKQKKDMDYGDERHHHLGLDDCFLGRDPRCFHRNSSWSNTAQLGLAAGVLGACLSFFVLLRNDAVSEQPKMWTLSTLISLVCTLPIGGAIGLLVLFLLLGSTGTVLTQVSGVVQVESPFGVAFACTLAALFSDRLVQTLSRLLDNIKITASSTKAEV